MIKPPAPVRAQPECVNCAAAKNMVLIVDNSNSVTTDPRKKWWIMILYNTSKKFTQARIYVSYSRWNNPSPLIKIAYQDIEGCLTIQFILIFRLKYYIKQLKWFISWASLLLPIGPDYCSQLYYQLPTTSLSRADFEYQC